MRPPRVVVEAREIAELQAGAPRIARKLGWPPELLELMRAARQPAQHILGADDRREKGARRAVERRGDKGAARLHELAGERHELRRIAGVLDDFEREDCVELRVACP